MSTDRLYTVDVCPMRYRSAIALLAAYANEPYPVKDMDAFMAVTLPWHVQKGDRVIKQDCTVAHMLEAIKQAGSWAFCVHAHDDFPNQIHYWVSKGTERSRLVAIFAHELFHLAGYPDETEACKVQAIAGFAYELAGGDRARH